MTNIICFPFAGGSETSYNFLKTHLPPGVHIRTVVYPGHGRRIQESPLLNLEAVVADALQQVLPCMDSDYILYGHSMGACVAFFLAEKIHLSHLPPPSRVVLSGHGVPKVQHHRKRHLLPRDLFFALLKELQGTPSEVLANEELLKIFEPVLRADFAVIDTFNRLFIPVLPFDLMLFHGMDDGSTTQESVRQWGKHFTGLQDIHLLTGGHFFIYEHAAFIARQLVDTAQQSHANEYFHEPFESKIQRGAIA